MSCACSICRGDSSKKNPLEYITPPPSPTIGDLLRRLGLGGGDDAIRTALKELVERRLDEQAPGRQ